MQKKLLAALTVLALNQAAGATDMERLRFSGFGTLGVVHSNDKSADFRSNIEQASRPGLTHKIDSGLDSVFGAQADINLLPGLTGTAQVISRRLSDMNLSKPYFEWANVKYQATRDLYVRGGRIVAPMFLISESRMVGYGQTAVRPSDEVYTINPVTYINGADIGYRFEGGPVLFKIGAAGGTLTQTITSGTATSKYYFNAKLFNGSAEYKGSTFRAGYAKLAIDIKSDMFAVRNAALDKLVANKVPNAYMVQENTATNNVNVDFYPVNSLTPDQVEKLFLGKTSAFPGGASAIPIDPPKGPERDAFYLKTTGKQPSQLKAYWSKQIFTGAGQPPKEAESAQELV